jgi:hypothetical protein
MHNRKWCGDKLWYLLYLPYTERYEVFCTYLGYNKTGLKAKRKLYLRKIREGNEVPPRRPEDYQPGEPPAEIARRLANAPLVGEAAVNSILENQDREKLHKQLDQALDNLNVDPSFVQSFRVSQWDGMTKNSEGEAEIHKLHGFQFNLIAESLEPKWDIVRRVESEPIPFNQSEKKEKVGEWKREVVLPDFQIGFWRQEDGSLHAMHDEKAIDVALQLVEKIQPSRIVILGDFLDLPNFSKYPQTPEFAQTTNASIEYGHRLLRTMREMLPDSKLVLIEGNHDKRLGDAVKRNFMEAYGIRRAGESLPVLSVPYLLALDDLGVEYVGGYPAGRYFINPNLMAIHGEFHTKGAVAKKLTEHEGISTIQGHNHRFEAYARTTRTYNGARQTYAYSAGTLSRIDGFVPSVHGGTQNGVPHTNHEDWQQAILMVEHDGNDFFVNPIHINLDHKARFEGETFEPAKPKRKRK